MEVISPIVQLWEALQLLTMGTVEQKHAGGRAGYGLVCRLYPKDPLSPRLLIIYQVVQRSLGLLVHSLGLSIGLTLTPLEGGRPVTKSKAMCDRYDAGRAKAAASQQLQLV